MNKIRKRGLGREANRAGMAVGGAVLSAVLIILWCIWGIPAGLFYHLQSEIPLLPRWLYLICDLAVHALLGAAIGAILCERHYACETQKYRGAFYFLLAILFGYLYYAFFFGINFFLVAFVLAVMELLGLLIAMLNFSHVIKLSALLAAIGCLWALYRCFLSFAAFFGI